MLCQGNKFMYDRRHAQRLLKYGFDLGPQCSPDSNLPPDDGDSMPASVRRTAPSNVVLNIADLRNSMLETVLSNNDGDDDSPKSTITAADALQLQPLSTEQQQLFSFSDQSHTGSQEGGEGMHVSSQASQDSRQTMQDSSQDKRNQYQVLAKQNIDSIAQDIPGSNCAVEAGQSQQQTGAAESLSDPLGQGEATAGPSGRQADSTAAFGDHADVHAGHQDQLPQYGRSISAMRGSRLRPPLASVRFAEEPDDQSHS